MSHTHYMYDWITFQTAEEYVAAVVNTPDVKHFSDDLKRICVVREITCDGPC